jgi:hypothetical protein
MPFVFVKKKEEDQKKNNVDNDNIKRERESNRKLAIF